MNNCKKINTDIRKSVTSWHGLCKAVLSEAKTAPEVTIDSDLLNELIEHVFYAGYIEANREVLEQGVDIGVQQDPHHRLWYLKDSASLVDPYPYFTNK